MFYRSQRVLWRVFAPSAAECAEILPPFFGHFSAKPKDTQALAAPDATSWSCWPPDFRYKALFEKGGERLAWRFLAVRCLIELLENVVGSCSNHWYVAGASCQGTAHGACIVGGLGSWESASLFLVLKVIWIVNSETKCRKSVGCRFQIMKTNFGTRLIDLLVVSTDLQVPWSFLLAICLSRLFRPELIRKSRLQELLKDRDSVHQASDDLTSLTFDFFLVMHEVDKVMIDDDTLWYFEVERWPLLSALTICKQDDLIDMLVGELEEPNTQSSLPRKERIARWMPCSWRLPLQLPCSLVIARGQWKECLCERIFIWCNNKQSVWWI